MLEQQQKSQLSKKGNPHKTFQVKRFHMIHESPGLVSSMREEDFYGVVVNDACKLLWVFISCSCHHLQYLSETNTLLS